MDIWELLRADVRAKATIENGGLKKSIALGGGNFVASNGLVGSSGNGSAGGGHAVGTSNGSSAGGDIALKLAAAASPLTVLHLQNSSRCCNLC